MDYSRIHPRYKNTAKQEAPEIPDDTTLVIYTNSGVVIFHPQVTHRTNNFIELLVVLQKINKPVQIAGRPQ